MNITRLLKYNQFLRRKYFETLSRLSWEDMIKDRGASFASLRDIFLHIVFVLDAYVNYTLQGNPNYPPLNFSEYDGMDKIKNYLDSVESKADAYLANITPQDLARNIERKQRDGSTILIPVEDLLLDFFQEETHHRGEMLALLWQMDVTPPHMGFIQYLRTQAQK